MYRLTLASLRRWYLVFTIASPAFAQSIDLYPLPEDEASFSITVNHAINRPTAHALIEGVYLARWTRPIGTTGTLIGEMPVMITPARYFYRFGLGNGFLGVQHAFGESRDMAFTFGLFLPTASGSLLDMARTADPLPNYRYERDALTFYGNYSVRHVFANGLVLGGEVGPHFLFHTARQSNPSSPVNYHYGATIGVEQRTVGFNVEYSGWWNPGEKNGPTMANMIGMGFQILSIKSQPLLFVRLPLDMQTAGASPYQVGLRVGM